MSLSVALNQDYSDHHCLNKTKVNVEMCLNSFQAGFFPFSVFEKRQCVLLWVVGSGADFHLKYVTTEDATVKRTLHRTSKAGKTTEES